MLIDTHCHMNIMVRNFDTTQPFTPFNKNEIEQFQKILNQAQQYDVSTVINVGTNYIESFACVEIAKIFPQCFATLGLHPNDATLEYQKDIDHFKTLLQQKEKNKIVGIGECGIDKHYPDFNLALQESVFHDQISLALQHDLALVIHSRDGDAETYNVLSQYKSEKNFRGTIHCFSSDENYAAKYLDLGFVLGFGGTLTYPKNNTLRAVAQMIPLEKIILETDAPFLPPQKLRGTKNEPANIKIIAEILADLRKESLEHVMQTTAQTTKKLFGIL